MTYVLIRLYLIVWNLPGKYDRERESLKQKKRSEVGEEEQMGREVETSLMRVEERKQSTRKRDNKTTE